MSFSKDGQSSAVAVLVGFGAMCALLLALVIWQPKASQWIAEAVTAEAPVPQGNIQGDVTASIRPANAPARKPIQSTAWAQVIGEGK